MIISGQSTVIFDSLCFGPRSRTRLNLKKLYKRHHDTQHTIFGRKTPKHNSKKTHTKHNFIQYNYTQQNGIQHNNKKLDTQHSYIQ
jgi:hypothetical protein